MSKKSLQATLDQLLSAQYPDPVPAFVRGRYQQEWEDVRQKEGELYLQVYQAVTTAARAAGEPVWNCSHGSGSFLFYLLDKGLNPLPPHYVCSACSVIEESTTAALCFDLPPKTCPACHQAMNRQGIHANPVEALWPDSLEIRLNLEFFKEAVQAALEALAGCIVIERRFNHQRMPENTWASYILAPGSSPEDTPVRQSETGSLYINAEDLASCQRPFRTIIIKAQPRHAMLQASLGMEEWRACPADISRLLEKEAASLREQGMEGRDNVFVRMQELVALLQAGTWTELIQALCLASGDYSRTGIKAAWELAGLIQASPYRHILYAREALQFYLQEQGVSRILARQVTQQLHRAQAGSNASIYQEQFPHLLQDPLFQACKHLWSRTHAITWLWKYFAGQEM